MQSFQDFHGTPGGPPPLLLTAEQVANLLGSSIRSVWRLNSEGKIPVPVNVKGTRWIRSEIEAWVKDGCPDISDDPGQYRGGGSNPAA